jgi:hypothetical protein
VATNDATAMTSACMLSSMLAVALWNATSVVVEAGVGAGAEAEVALLCFPAKSLLLNAHMNTRSSEMKLVMFNSPPVPQSRLSFVSSFLSVFAPLSSLSGDDDDDDDDALTCMNLDASFKHFDSSSVLGREPVNFPFSSFRYFAELLLPLLVLMGRNSFAVAQSASGTSGDSTVLPFELLVPPPALRSLATLRGVAQAAEYVDFTVEAEAEGVAETDTEASLTGDVTDTGDAPTATAIVEE